MELKIENLSKHYGSKIAVNNFNTVLNEGIHALLGSNGSGKTTLMRMLCGVLNPTSGTVYMNGTNIAVMGEQYRDLLGYLPQNFGYYPNFTGWDFMIYLAALKGLPKITAIERCEELLRSVGLYEVRNKKIKTYSGGMRQRIGIAQALINDPSILVLDEPTVGLDPKERTKFRNIISNLSEDKIVLLSTHIVSDIEYIADDILVMKNGELALKEHSDSICGNISGSVWIGTIDRTEADKLMKKFIVSNLRHAEGMIEMRIVSETKPFDNAVQTEPNLEDLYLYYFKEDCRNELNEI